MGRLVYRVFLGADAGDPPADQTAEDPDESFWRSRLDSFEEHLARYSRGFQYPLFFAVTDDYHTKFEGNILGLYIVGPEAITPMTRGFALDGFLDIPEYKAAYETGLQVWCEFREFMIALGHSLGEPRLWLLESEVA